MTLRVLLVDDQMLIRQGIKSLLQLSGQVEVVAEAPDGSTVVELVQLHQPDVILLDLSMPKVDGIATLELLKQQQLKTPVLILTTFEEHDLVLKSIQLGAKGYLLKDVSLDSFSVGHSNAAARRHLFSKHYYRTFIIGPESGQ